MASFTISATTNWSTFRAGDGSTFVNNDDLVINEGIVFTIDTDLDRIIGKVTADGVYLIDSTGVTSLTYIGSISENITVNATGGLRTRGKMISLAISDGSTSQVVTPTFNKVPGLWVETGRRIYFDNENLSPRSGQDNYTPVTGDLLFLQSNKNYPIGKIVEYNNTNDYLVVECLYSTLTDNDPICIMKDTKTWTLDRALDSAWSGDVVGAHVLESGIYSRWHNANGFSTSITDYGTGWGCNVFNQTYGGDIIFSDGINGNIPI